MSGGFPLHRAIFLNFSLDFCVRRSKINYCTSDLFQSRANEQLMIIRIHPLCNCRMKGLVEPLLRGNVSFSAGPPVDVTRVLGLNVLLVLTTHPRCADFRLFVSSFDILLSRAPSSSSPVD